MRYDFDNVIDRTNTDSVKCAGVEDHFGVKEALPMWVADMDFQSPTPVIEALVDRARHGVFGYPRRTTSYLDSMVEWMQKRHGWSIHRDWLANAPGVVNALILAVHALTHPGDKIVIQPPVYHPFASIVKNNGRQLVLNPLTLDSGHYRMDLADLESKIDQRTKLLILCSPHNPVGRVWTRKELSDLGEICLRKGVTILSDEIHSDLTLRGHVHTPMAAISSDLANQTLTFIAPSKTFNIPGLNASAVIIPNSELRGEFKQAVNSFGLETGNVFGIVGLEAAYRCGDEWLEQLLEYLEENIAFAIRYFEERIPRIKVICPEGTYLLWLDCRELGLSNPDLNNLMLRQAGVALNDGPMFGPGGEGFQRMNVGCPRSVLEKGLSQIEAAVNRLVG